MIPFGGGVKRAWSSGVEGATCSLLRFRLVGRCLAVKEMVRSARGGLMAQSGCLGLLLPSGGIGR